jgi:adenine-specific DNA-methyltransferase
LIDDVSNADGKLELKKIFNITEGREIPFDNPKPTGLLKYLIKPLLSSNDIVLDIFAGSATIAHATIDLNIEDGYSRKFICVQLPELTDEKSEAFKAGYKTIADVGKDRIRKVISKIKEKNQKSSELFKTDISNVDLGFKVFKLSKSNFKIWDSTLEKETEVIQAKLFEHIKHISPEAEQEAILFELLLKSGFELTTPIEKLTLAGLSVFSIAEGQLLICLEKELTHDCIKAMAEIQPIRVICLDEGFNGENADALKTNAVQIMKSKGVVNFRTV